MDRDVVRRATAVPCPWAPRGHGCAPRLVRVGVRVRSRIRVMVRVKGRVKVRVRVRVRVRVGVRVRPRVRCAPRLRVRQAHSSLLLTTYY
eukprot:scaffold123408_cov51-Phaeocystis_antarctica.AAC.1